MRGKGKTQALPKWLFSELVRLSSEASRKAFLARHRELLRVEVVSQLAEAVREQVRVDPPKAVNLAEAALAIARKLRSKEALARGLRAKANALYALGENKVAVELHEEAGKLFQQLGNSLELARTFSASLQPLILLGEYDRAFASAERARELFRQKGDALRLARLDINVGNIFHRQDRFTEALDCYERAYQQLLLHKDTEGIAAVLSNLAVCQISLNDFPRALEVYGRARAFCEQHRMPLLVAQADYNIAYLYYLRGEYSRAIGMLRAAHEDCRKTGDTYHVALCHLDLSDIYLELNLGAEAAEMAQAACTGFERLRMGYEKAKALTNQAIALSRQGKAFRAVELFAQARTIFQQEKNRVWPSLLDLYQAVVLYDQGRLFETRRLCAQALKFFRSSTLAGKEVLCRLLIARLCLRLGDGKGAHRECAVALERLNTVESPALNYQAHFLMGQIEESGGNRQDAYDSYQASRAALETLRNHLRGEELKISFMKNKLEVYGALVELCLGRNGDPASREEAFSYIEQAKSRSLTDLMFQRGHVLPAGEPGQSGLARRIRDLREELNWYYHRIGLEQLQPEERSPERIESLQKRAQEQENELLRALRELPSSEPEWASLHASAPVPIKAIRAALPPGAVLLEYFQVRERILAAVLTRDKLEIVPATVTSRVSNQLRMLQFQLSKFRFGSEYLQAFQSPLFQATQAHLNELYEELIAPVRSWLTGDSLVLVPHGLLHYLPFHALFDGERYLIDSFKVSYAPSATIYALCHGKTANAQGSSLILGIPDARAPFILEEVQSVAGILPGPELFVGSGASESVLREKGPRSRLVHIATHGNFRQDNPMFSGIRMGDAYLSLYDLYSLKLPAELITLSGCATGMNVVAAGDELLGLVRGLLYAGAQSLLLTLWDVHDRSTAEFMKLFYAGLGEHPDKAGALRCAMIQLRERYPHPYYWAPFLLVGKAFPT